MEVAPVPIQYLATLLSEDYRTFSADKMLGIEEKYTLNHFQFAEVVAVWIITLVSSNKGSQDGIRQVLGALRLHELNEDYLDYLKRVILDECELTLIYPVNANIYQYINHVFSIEDPLYFEKIEHQNYCKMCGTTCRFTVTFHKDRIPCYELTVEDSSCRVEHVYFYLMYEIFGHFWSCSLLTDSYNSVRDVWNGCLKSYNSVRLCYLYKCGKK